MLMKIIQAALLTACCIFGPSPHAADAPDAQYVAELFFAAKKAGTHYPDILRINPDLDEAFLYDVQRRFVAMQIRSGASIGGYKGGFIPKSSIGGVLFAQGILRGSPTLESRDFQSLLVEAEIAFQLCGPLSAPLADVAALKSATCKVYPAIELPDAALPDLDRLRKDFPHLRRLLIPTNMAVSHLLLGDERAPAGIDLDHLDVTIKFNGTAIGNRDGTKSQDDIWTRVLWVVNDFVIANDYEIAPDHIIIPGALTGLHAGKPGAWEVDYGALGKIEFQIR
jgi:2-keto-4-pentenoate hydratase